jgi:hypothetical protein
MLRCCGFRSSREHQAGGFSRSSAGQRRKQDEQKIFAVCAKRQSVTGFYQQARLGGCGKSSTQAAEQTLLNGKFVRPEAFS